MTSPVSEIAFSAMRAECCSRVLREPMPGCGIPFLTLQAVFLPHNLRWRLG
jgi:hypothetical protein